jgi:serine/threonine protein kinase
MIGKMLGHYRVGEQLGRGGMGEVYFADDLNLNRKVALKFLPDAFTGDPERMARFEREAKLLASLNHPNIAAIYGLEQAEGKRFIVMELVKGETLAQRLSKGSLPVDEALGICRQIAEGLEAAHEKGVIHRDLKPANVMITEGDKVKILDFGLAKALSEETQTVDSSQSPTLTEAMTRPGVILGTAAYMSPEQAKGRVVDKRADIWAFGCILYECLTGKSGFEGETVTETLAAVLTKEQDWSEVPEKIRPLLRRCLEKDPKKRLRDIGEAMAWIESAPESAPGKNCRLAWIWSTVATLLFLAAAIPAFLYFRGREAPMGMVFQISTPRMPNDYAIAVSPDGRAIAFVASSSGAVPSLFVREMGSVTPRQLEGTEGASTPFWSPDSRSIGFFAGGKLKISKISGGMPRDICAAGTQGGWGGTWNSEGMIIFGLWPTLRRVSAAGGEAVAITTLDRSRPEVGHIYPSFLPDGRHYIYTTIGGTTGRICVGSLDSQEKTLLYMAS